MGLLVVSAFTLSLAPAAMAAQPEREEIYDSGVDVPHACPDLTLTYTTKGHLTTFFNSTGEPVQLVFHINFKAAMTNTASGNTYSNRAYETIEIDLQTGNLTVNGLFLNIVVRGEGPILTDVGTIRFDENFDLVFQGGPHMTLADGTDVCAVLV